MQFSNSKYKQLLNLINLMMSKEKTQNNTIKVGHKFLTLLIKFVSLVVVGQKKQTHYLV